MFEQCYGDVMFVRRNQRVWNCGERKFLADCARFDRGEVTQYLCEKRCVTTDLQPFDHRSRCVAAPTFAVATGSLPAGVTLNPTRGALSGLPTTAGAPTFAVSATKRRGRSELGVGHGCGVAGGGRASRFAIED
jgi:Putative Ig domain